MSNYSRNRIKFQNEQLDINHDIEIFKSSSNSSICENFDNIKTYSRKYMMGGSEAILFQSLIKGAFEGYEGIASRLVIDDINSGMSCPDFIFYKCNKNLNEAENAYSILLDRKHGIMKLLAQGDSDE